MVIFSTVHELEWLLPHLLTLTVGYLMARLLMTPARAPDPNTSAAPAEPDPKSSSSGALPSSDTLHALVRKRRSIFPKDFEALDGADDGVPREVITQMLEAANWAPTHGKTEPWRFTVLSGREAIEQMQAIKMEFMEADLKDNADKLEAFRSKMSKKAKELVNVSSIVVLIVKRVRNQKGNLMPFWEEMAATSCAIQNMHLALTTHWGAGYGGYWSSGGYDSWLNCDAFRAFVGADGAADNEDDKIIGLFYLGRAKVEKMDMYRAKRGPVADKVQWIGDRS